MRAGGHSRCIDDREARHMAVISVVSVVMMSGKLGASAMSRKHGANAVTSRKHGKGAVTSGKHVWMAHTVAMLADQCPFASHASHFSSYLYLGHASRSSSPHFRHACR